MTERPPEPPAAPRPLQGVDEGTEQVTQELPEPVGPISGEVIDRVVGLGEQVLGLPGGSGQSGSGGGQSGSGGGQSGGSGQSGGGGGQSGGSGLLGTLNGR